MAFVLGNQDFQQIRTDRAQRALEADRINARNFAEDEALRLANEPRLGNPQGQGLGPPMKPNQVGLTAAQAAAKAEYEKRIAAAKAAKAAAAAAPKVGLTTTAPTIEPDSLRARGINLPTFDPTSQVSRIGKRGSPEFSQINPETQSQAGMLGRTTMNEANFFGKLQSIRQGLSLLGTDSTPATGVFGRIKGAFTDDAAGRKARRDAGVVTDWYDSNEANQFFRQNPNLLDMAAKDPIGFYQSLRGSGKVVPTKLPGGGVSLPYDPATGAVGVIPEEAAVERSKAFAAEVSPRLLASVIQVESGGNPEAISPKGAKGILQVLDGTMKKPGYGVTPAQNDSDEERDRVGRDYLGAMLLQYERNIDHALAAYNWGPGNVDKWINNGADMSKLPTETKNYIQRVKSGVSTVTPEQVVQAQATAAAPSGTEEITTVAGRRKREREIKAGVTLPGEKKSVAEEVATAPDFSEIKEPDIKMPFGLRTQELNTLMASRRDLASRLRSLRGQPNSDKFRKARSEFTANGAMIQNMSQTQALNTLQISNDPRMLNQILNRQSPGANIRISPNSDGTFRVEMGGRVIADRKDKTRLIGELRRKNSIEYHKALNSAAATATTEAQKAALEFSFKIRELHTQKNYDVMIENMKLSGLFKGIENVFKRNPDGTYQVFLPSVGLDNKVIYTWQSVPSDVAVKHRDTFKRSTK
jgi:soluble lytic murein transglycosylase-like protein